MLEQTPHAPDRALPCCAVGGTDSDSDGICTHSGNAGQMVYAWNNILFGWNYGTAQASAFCNSTLAGITMYAYNNTIYDSNYGFNQNSGSTIVAKNNIVIANVAGFQGDGRPYGSGWDIGADELGN